MKDVIKIVLALLCWVSPILAEPLYTTNGYSDLGSIVRCSEEEGLWVKEKCAGFFPMASRALNIAHLMQQWIKNNRFQLKTTVARKIEAPQSTFSFSKPYEESMPCWEVITPGMFPLITRVEGYAPMTFRASHLLYQLTHSNEDLSSSLRDRIIHKNGNVIAIFNLSDLPELNLRNMLPRLLAEGIAALRNPNLKLYVVDDMPDTHPEKASLLAEFFALIDPRGAFRLGDEIKFLSGTDDMCVKSIIADHRSLIIRSAADKEKNIVRHLHRRSLQGK